MPKMTLKPYTIREFDRSHAMAIFSIEEIAAELKRLRKATGVTGRRQKPDLEDDEWEWFMTALCALLGPLESASDALADALHASQNGPDHLPAMRGRIDQALAALRHAGDIHGTDYSPTQTVLLPVAYAQRVSYLLGNGVLPVVWVHPLNLLAF